MKRDHEKPPFTTRVAEPVQVYLAPADRRRLDRLAEQLQTTKSAILRRGLEALERQLTRPEAHPALRIIGIAEEELGPPLKYDLAREHDRYLAELAQPRPAKPETRAGRGKPRGR
ncbi:MAG TPA: hypothetical protein VGQ73_04935 [Gemmatimonadales bacterium]|jgi:predicted transcriptional regulator|nr:hypothetical protein [Gemmatimonadales bacterium]